YSGASKRRSQTVGHLAANLAEINYDWYDTWSRSCHFHFLLAPVLQDNIFVHHMVQNRKFTEALIKSLVQILVVYRDGNAALVYKRFVVNKYKSALLFNVVQNFR